MPSEITSDGFAFSYIYQLFADDFRCSFLNVAHTANPFNLILFLKLFGDTFPFHHLLYEGIEHIPCLFVNVGKVRVKSEVSDEGVIKDSFVLLQVAFVQASPLTYRTVIFLFGENQIRQIIVAALHYLRILSFIILSLPAKTGSF